VNSPSGISLKLSANAASATHMFAVLVVAGPKREIGSLCSFLKRESAEKRRKKEKTCDMLNII
jgi:hypothetical protein